jgi:hypothetical protein
MGLPAGAHAYWLHSLIHHMQRCALVDGLLPPGN